MVSDEASDGAKSDGTTGGDPVPETVFGLAGSPGRSLAVAIVVLAVLFYGIFIQQQLLVVVWLLAVGFLVYLLWRFVRAHERIASAAERLADSGD